MSAEEVRTHRHERLYDGARVVSISGAAGGAVVALEFTEAEGPQEALSALSRLVLAALLAAREVEREARPRSLWEVFGDEDSGMVWRLSLDG